MIISLVILLGGSELHQDEVGFDPNSDSIAHLQGQSFFAMEDDLTFYSLSNGAQLQSLLPRRADEGCSAAGLITDLSDLLDLDQVSLIRIPDALVETIHIGLMISFPSPTSSVFQQKMLMKSAN